MTNQPAPGSNGEQGATVVITHRVREGQQDQYESWLNEIGPLCRSYPGHLDWQIIRPIAGLTGTYTVVIRFDTREHLENWMGSPDRKRLIRKIRSTLAMDDDFFVSSGLDFSFVPDGAKAQVPVRWKQFLITWSAIYPLALGVPLGIVPLQRMLRISPGHYGETLLITGAVVALMVYVVMPRYTK